MKQQLQEIKKQAEEHLKNACTADALEELRIKYLGKKGELTAILKGMGKLAAEERPVIGAMANEIREFLSGEIDAKKAEIEKLVRDAKLKSEVIDISMPGRKPEIGTSHPITKVLDEFKDAVVGMGFQIMEGPEVETDYYNFEALNIPKNHPARDTQDTFYIDENTVLRTQTSPMQIRVMENTKPPIRIIAPGRVYRSDAVDATHSPIFHQIEGLVVDKGITMADLKGTLETLIRSIYGEHTKVRFRPHHFPFTEPSAETDVCCFNCGGKGCSVCKGEGWIEILGCGMVHPKVLANCGIDPEIYSGFAFGIGLERLVMGRYDINDIRLFFENDVRFLKQF
ncbi:MAG: phenylalanine--tRNA ligase subunit alpha [Clostridiales bacterium]|nr:phenylalanine--tRNA ligase subunit alpha [Clostridiales bacterium]